MADEFVGVFFHISALGLCYLDEAVGHSVFNYIVGAEDVVLMHRSY